MPNVYIQEACNLFCGNHDPQNSKFLTLEEHALPTLEEILVEHNAGGGKFAVEFAVGIQKLTSSFKLKGMDPAMLREFGLGSTIRKTYTSYGVIRDKKTGKAIESKAIIEARLSKIAPDPFKRGEASSHDYGLNEILHYELWFNGKEELYFDFFTNTVRQGGIDPDPDFNNILRIGNTI